MAGTYPEAWQDKVLIAVRAKGDDYVVNLQADVSKVTRSGGDKGGASVPMVSGGYKWTHNPQEPYKLDMEAIVVNAYVDDIGDTNNISLEEMYAGASDSSGVPRSIGASQIDGRTEFRVSFLWTDDVTADSAENATALDKVAVRESYKGMRLVNLEWDFDGKVKKYTLSFEGPARDASNNNNFLYDETDGSTGTELSAISTY